MEFKNENELLSTEVITDLETLAADYSKGLPESKDGVKCSLYSRHSLVNGEGETVDAPEDASDFYFDIVFGFGDEDYEHCFTLHVSLVEGSFSVSEYDGELNKLNESVREFLLCLDGVNHREYLRALAGERYQDRNPEDPVAPFDYKRFFIGASIVCATLILMLFVINDILPKLL